MAFRQSRDNNKSALDNVSDSGDPGSFVLLHKLEWDFVAFQ